ncbi:Cro-like protein, phage associated [Streptococcus acidominimus]|uniref:Cro-like protein, phage associated n=1 Tax=Streptococcus acidominimus TaxID=1326 RepID=A0A239WZB5_STRAI|nr:helix-turn-helix transcriptional regulator [Streptococcus acidominimus]SNV39619.1 Cro-like protein, phage associated [Streptococcus acidominimus]
MTKMTLKMARAKKGYSQEKIADKLGVVRQTYQNYENYKTPMDVETAFRFSQVVDVDFDDIIFFKQNYTSSV